MRLSFASSFLLHAFVIAIAYYGLPYFSRKLEIKEEAIWINIENFEEKSNVPDLPPQPDKEIKDKPKAPQKTISKQKEIPKPIPAPRQQFEQEVKAKPERMPVPDAMPKPVTKQKAKPTPKKESKRKEISAPKLKLAKIKPRRKPKAPDNLTKIMKTLEQLKSQSPKIKNNKPIKKNSGEFVTKMTNALSQSSKQFNANLPLSLSDLDRVRQQIRACWNPPPGQANAEDMMIELALFMNKDGTVRKAKIENSNQIGQDPVFRAAADAARRAVLNPKCNPLKLPPEKYSQWQKLLLSFNPKDMY